jgi:hypothetical protein
MRHASERKIWSSRASRICALARHQSPQEKQATRPDPNTDFNTCESALCAAALAAAPVVEAALDALRDETWLAARAWRERASPV